jgi:hypothetical protein
MKTDITMTFFRAVDEKHHCNDEYQYKMPLKQQKRPINHHFMAAG